MKQYDYIVLGGGVSGLGFAKRMSENGKSVLILEKEAVVGGLSRSLLHNGFYLDFCAHRFHTNNKKMLAEILALPGLKMEKHVKKSRIYMFGRYLKYPFEIQNLLRAMPLHESFLCGISFIYNQVARRFRKTDHLQSYKDWFVRLYGERLYKVMCYPYTSKIWHVDPAHISGDWADQRFQGENMKKLLLRVAKKLLRFDFSSYNLDDDSLAPDGGPFYYPLRGIQEMPDALKKASESNGATISTSVEITSISRADKSVTYTEAGEKKVATFGHLISTIPFDVLYALQDRKDDVVAKAVADLKYMDIIFIYVFLNKPQISNDHWLYFPDKDIIFNRAVEFSNWSPVMCPEGKTSICFDVTTFEEDKEWKMSDQELVNRTISDSERIGYFKKEEVIDTLVVRVKYAYPFYDIHYREKLDKVVTFFEDGTTSLLGRTGIFRYNNSDNSIEMGFDLADKLLAGDNKATVYEYKVKQVSY